MLFQCHFLECQQGEAICTYTDLKVRMLYGEMGVDYWNAKVWEKELDEYEVKTTRLGHLFFSFNLLHFWTLESHYGLRLIASCFTRMLVEIAMDMLFLKL